MKGANGWILKSSLSLLALGVAVGAVRADDASAKAGSRSTSKTEEARPPAGLDPRGAVVPPPGEAAPPDKGQLDLMRPAPPIEPGALLPTGYRRASRTERVPLASKVREAIETSGKSAEIDPRTGERIVRTIVDSLPEGWGARSVQDAEAPVDSLGRPIVSTAPGLPGWAQADVDGLRAAIAHWSAERAAAAAAGRETRETDGILGNFVGQAVVRGIAIDDLVNLGDGRDGSEGSRDDRPAIGDGIARSIIDYLRFHENLKFVHAEGGAYVYEPSVYPDRIVALVEAHGSRMEDVLRISGPQDQALVMTPSGCYTRTAFAQGMTILSGQTNIWVANGFDDERADVPTGFPIFFSYECQNPANSDAVRVSTNGYLTFFQKGGGALEGQAYTNAPISAGSDPDGFVAPWWDDLIVATSQGSADRVSYKTEGAVHQRVFTVEWFSMSRLGGSTNDFHFFQVKLYETTGVIELHFGGAGNWMADPSDDATSGLENDDGSNGDCGPNCLDTNASEPPNNYRFAPDPRPSNEGPCGGIALRVRHSLTQQSLRNALADGATTCGSSNGNRDVFYTFLARCAGTLNIDTCGSRDANSPGSGPDTVLSLYKNPTCPADTFNTVACNDDGNVPGCSAVDSAISYPFPIANDLVSVRVSHFGDLANRIGNGLFGLNTNFMPSAPVENDLCSAPRTVVSGQTTFGNLPCAGADGQAQCGDSAGNPDIWYRFTAPAPGGVLTVDLCGTRDNHGMDTVLSVYTGCPGDLAHEIACNDDGFVPGCNGLDSAVSVPLAPGQTVLIRVSHFGVGDARFGDGQVILHANFCVVPEVGGLTFTNKTTLAWQLDALASTYDVVRGQLGQLPVGPGGGDETCLADDTAAGTLIDASLPLPQHGLWYLVRAKNACGHGTYGIENHSPTPPASGPPRMTTTCP